ncbi:hypothetical protein JK358_37865 [Nocardia sp. 2]|uniref:AAA+ ATPase domain-containing protein n=1 Tax=Nocardia acididurans TaxID=2802282 RepID=A0ABS1MHN4_9NOCA|nr:hypothetical protein [Nocardia acididurans]MBL1080178.1 hypothetical protein [Nocardia acididurans]
MTEKTTQTGPGPYDEFARRVFEAVGDHLVAHHPGIGTDAAWTRLQDALSETRVLDHEDEPTAQSADSEATSSLEDIRTSRQLGDALKDLILRSYRSLSAFARESGSRVSEVHLLTGEGNMHSWAAIERALDSCNVRPPDVIAWWRAYVRVVGVQYVPVAMATDAFDLGVHPPISVAAEPAVPTLPRYVARAHDIRVRDSVRRAVGGTSTMIVAVGDAQAGKTRTLWEALQRLASQDWHLLKPAAGELSHPQVFECVCPRTVIWLDDLDIHLDALTLRTIDRLLTSHSQNPVLILATLRVNRYRQLDAAAHRLVTSSAVAVPGAFTGPDLVAARVVAAMDPRVAMAVEHADEGRIAQYLTGAHEVPVGPGDLVRI